TRLSRDWSSDVCSSDLIDVQDQAIVNEMVLSHEHELRLPLRWIALLYGRTKLDLVMNTGVVNGQDALKGLLAGATAVQVASTLRAEERRAGQECRRRMC